MLPCTALAGRITGVSNSLVACSFSSAASVSTPSGSSSTVCASRWSSTVASQATAYDPAHPEDAQYVENVRFERVAGKKGVMFVTLNIPGGSNNDADPWKEERYSF